MAKRRVNAKTRGGIAARKAKREKAAKSKNIFAIAAFGVAGAVYIALMVWFAIQNGTI